MALIDRFIRLGRRWFSDDGWHRVPFQPILYFMLWGAVLRMIVVDDPPIQFEKVFHPSTATAWLVLGVVCPPLALLSWWLIMHCRWSRAALAGLWVRLGADLGQFTALITYHIVTVLTLPPVFNESRVYARYAVGACMLFVATLVVRDVWALVATERLASRMRRGDG